MHIVNNVLRNTAYRILKLDWSEGISKFSIRAALTAGHGLIPSILTVNNFLSEPVFTGSYSVLINIQHSKFLITSFIYV